MLYKTDCQPAARLLVLSSLACALGHATTSLAAADPNGPAAIDAGPVAITPTVGLEAKYRDNIYLQEHDTTSSWISTGRGRSAPRRPSG